MTDDEHHEALGAMIHAMKPRQPTQEELEKPCHETLPFTPGPLLQTINYHREIADERDRLWEALNNLLNDCINFDGGKLTDAIMREASAILKETKRD